MAEVRCETTIWIWPSGLFPRRLVYYFRAKGITLRVLRQHRISIIPVELTSSPPALHSMAGFEARPDNSSLPTMRIEYSDGRTAWIRESLSIIDYFEDLFPSSAGGVSVRGSSAEQNAQVQDILSLLNDAMHWSLIHLIHADPRTIFFSGLKKEEMSVSTASHATKKLQFYLERLEQWLQADSHVKSLVLPSLALLAQVDYHEMMYGTDWLVGHQVLKQWVEEVRGEPWFISNNGLKSVERGEGWSSLLGDEV